ncbi:hypothetical protein TSOC_005611, partial [Tetrabaena socialis]
ELVRLYRCKEGVSLLASPLSATKLSPALTADEAIAECKGMCDARAETCTGYTYKKTGWCYLVADKVVFTKPYPSDLTACIFKGVGTEDDGGR